MVTHSRWTLVSSKKGDVEGAIYRVAIRRPYVFKISCKLSLPCANLRLDQKKHLTVSDNLESHLMQPNSYNHWGYSKQKDRGKGILDNF